MQFETVLQLYLEHAKRVSLSWFGEERTRACQWIKNLEDSPNENDEDKKIHLHSLKLLLLTLESHCLVGPFEEDPKDIENYDWLAYKLDDFSDMIAKKQKSVKNPEILYTVSADQRKLVTFQNDLENGQFCYYAISTEPIDKWDNLNGGAFADDSVNYWKERSAYDELNNDEEADRVSFDFPNCERETTKKEEEIDDRPNVCKILSPNKGTPVVSPSGMDACQYTGMQGESYGMEDFDLPENEQFYSPSEVLEDYNDAVSPTTSGDQVCQRMTSGSPQMAEALDPARAKGIIEFGLSEIEQYRSASGVSRNLNHTADSVISEHHTCSLSPVAKRQQAQSFGGMVNQPFTSPSGLRRNINRTLNPVPSEYQNIPRNPLLEGLEMSRTFGGLSQSTSGFSRNLNRTCPVNAVASEFQVWPETPTSRVQMGARRNIRPQNTSIPNLNNSTNPEEHQSCPRQPTGSKQWSPIQTVRSEAPMCSRNGNRTMNQGEHPTCPRSPGPGGRPR